ncbi:GNAT family N-acetyltransferase [Streptomyces sp. NBC_01218]|uniref:GNAT family N-acetyltransferase n=1 Tax=Streptomyces sp. NBC_01218 TaxID=2903780 RepID=UPI002E122B60|nr:GNAT family N-acetyltransferase [Streptomyces sp. NBC_01218]WSQ55153.1 GNAT family N-acetyltransferase [Streptomyces sp. NBC_01218]
MSERTVHLDADPRDWRCRKIRVRPHRWYVTVELDRDGYVDAASSRGHAAELPDLYTDAVEKVQAVAVDRLWYDGYPGSFTWGSGSRWVTLPVPYTEVEAAVEALRAAEIDQDYDGLAKLAGRLALPVDGWLAPGERELVRGVDFHSPPAVFLRFLRGKARRSGLRLNGRATAGSVWVRPMLPSAQKWLREMFPEQYPGWVDRWSGQVEPDDVPYRPWVGGRDQDLSYRAMPVRFKTVKPSVGSDCRCGMGLKADVNGGDHAGHHAQWAFGVRVPKNLDWLGDLVVVTTQSAIVWRRLVYKVAKMPQRENHYDFRSWSHLGEPEETEDNVRAYLLQANGYVIGYLAAHDTDHHRPWDLGDASEFGKADDTLRPRIDLVWVADAYRRQGVGATLVQALADDFGSPISEVSWSTPISRSGRQLARRLSPDGIWVS